jgi:hypothetical protein
MTQQNNVSASSGLLPAAAAAWANLPPPIKSLATSSLLIVAVKGADWLAATGVIAKSDETSVEGYIVTGIGTAIMLAIMVWKAYSQRRSALMKAVNVANNGAVVVPAEKASAAGIQPINGPIVKP